MLPGLMQLIDLELAGPGALNLLTQIVGMFDNMWQYYLIIFVWYVCIGQLLVQIVQDFGQLHQISVELLDVESHQMFSFALQLQVCSGPTCGTDKILPTL